MHRRANQDRGATDPILVIAAIVVSLVLLVGGSFAVSAAITNARNLNAQQNLERVATAEEAFAGTNGTYTDYSPADGQLKDTGLTFTAADGTYTAVNTCGAGRSWYAASRSESGAVFLRTSASTATTAAPGTTLRLPSCVTTSDLSSLAATVAVGRTNNLLRNASFETGTDAQWNYNHANLLTASIGADGGALGPHYMRLRYTSLSTGFGSGIYQFGTQVTAGKTYEASAAMRAATAAGQATVRVEWFKADGAILTASDYTSTNLPATWNTMKQTAVAPANAGLATVTIYADGTWNPGDTWDVDAVSLAEAR